MGKEYTQEVFEKDLQQSTVQKEAEEQDRKTKELTSVLLTTGKRAIHCGKYGELYGEILYWGIMNGLKINEIGICCRPRKISDKVYRGDEKNAYMRFILEQRVSLDETKNIYFLDEDILDRGTEEEMIKVLTLVYTDYRDLG